MKNLVTSDPHYFHANIIRYSKRPYLKDGDIVPDPQIPGQDTWASTFIKRTRAKEMTDDLIIRHNAKVDPDDTVWLIGDFCFGDSATVISLLRRLNGNFNFIWGNHDEPLKAFAKNVKFYPDLAPRVKFLGDVVEANIEGQDFVLNHYAMRVWNGSHKGVWHLYGHSHGTLPDDPNSMSFDVGVDCHNYVPLTIPEVKAIMAKKEFKPVDHHGQRRS